ncbi:MAG: septum formation initiator family protein [Solobacterium sp.]|jgi:cell division protein DivIC|nr:septum formation initiator family protein [Solobacterium sp.]
MAKKKKIKRSWGKTMIGFLLIAVSAYLLYLVGNEVFTTITLRRQLEEVQLKLQEMQDENNYLVNQKAKLMDPDYVESYARSNYMFSKDGEAVFYLPQDANK